MSSTLRTRLLTGAAIPSIVLTIAAVFARARLISDIPNLVLAVGSPYVALVALSGLVVTHCCRQKLLSPIAIAVVVAALAVQIAWYYRGQPVVTVGQHVDIRVLSSNLRHGHADPNFVVGLAERADVITVSELNPEAGRRFQQAGIDGTFPYSHLIPAPGAGGIGIWSRYPLTALSVPRHAGRSIPGARLEVPGLATEPLLASVHVISPVAGEQNTVAEWRGGMAGAKAQLTNFGWYVNRW